jgi:hypothetical protein
MISATCCRCGRELDKKGGIVLRPPEKEAEELFGGLLGDGTVKHHVCAACMESLLEWLRGSFRSGTPGQPYSTERLAAPPGSPERRIDQSEDWATIEASYALSVTANVRLAEKLLNAESLLKETLPFLKRARDHWPETSSPQAFVAQIDDLEARIDAVLLRALTPSVRPTHTTAHILFEGRPLCGFMAGCVPSGWPDGHKWVSITEVKEVDGKPGFLHDEHSTPCDRCLSLASASSLIRNRA